MTYKLTWTDSVSGDEFSETYTSYTRACKAMNHIASCGMPVTLEITTGASK